MSAAVALLHARMADAVAAPNAPVPLVVGACGSGRTTALLKLRDDLGETRAQYIDVERVATTPERFLGTVVRHTRFCCASPGGAPASARDAYDAALVFLTTARTLHGEPATFLLDEFLELKTFESFPGLRTAIPDLVRAIGQSPNRFVLTSRFAARAKRLVNGVSGRLRVVTVPQVPLAEIEQHCREAWPSRGQTDISETARTIAALSSGHCAYVCLLVESMASIGAAADPISALAALLAPGGRLSALCRFVYEFRLHRARGYGALKGILDVLAEEEPLTLTAIAQRLQRTPGSTKDYLSWLEDVDLITATKKRYGFADPVLRLWVRLFNRPSPPRDEDVAREIHRYVAALLPDAGEPVGASTGRDRWNDIIEFD